MNSTYSMNSIYSDLREAKPEGLRVAKRYRFQQWYLPNGDIVFKIRHSLTDRSSGHKTDRIVTKFYTLIHTINMKVKFELQYHRTIFTVVTVVLRCLHYLKHSVAIFRDTVTRLGSK